MWNYSVHVNFCIDLGSKTEWSPAAVPRTPVQTFHVRGRDPTAEGSGAAAQGSELPAQSPERWHSSTVFIYHLVCYRYWSDSLNANLLMIYKRIFIHYVLSYNKVRDTCTSEIRDILGGG